MERKRGNDLVMKCKSFESNFRYLIEFTPFQVSINCAFSPVNFDDNFRRGGLRSRSFYHQIGKYEKTGVEEEANGSAAMDRKKGELREVPFDRSVANANVQSSGAVERI